MVNQKRAVTNAVLKVKPDYVLNGDVTLASVLTDSDKAELKQILISGFLEGEIEMSDEGKTKYFSQPAELAKYVTGLINNWVRKNSEFNGGGSFSYTAKNPGSRRGSSNETVRALRQLLAITTDQEARQAIETEITSQLESLKPKVEIKIEAMPAHLRHLLG